MKKIHTAYDIKIRLFALFLAITFIFFVLIIRLFIVQVVDGRSLQAKALNQWLREVPLTAKRGDIVDCNGNTVVTTKTTYDIYLRAKSIDNPEGVAKILSGFLNIDYDIVYKKACNKKVSEVTLAKKVSKEIIDKIIESDVKGVYFSSDIERVYLYDEMLCQVLGFMSSDNTGQGGIEQYYNKFLEGKDGKNLTESDIRGLELEDATPMYLPAIDGMNVMLTIDLGIQRIVENAVKNAMVQHSPKNASAIVMDATNGEILALANAPSFDLNNPPRDNISELMKLTRNKMVVDIYEPGSTFKVLTAAASLEEWEKGNKKAFSATHIFANNSNYREVDGQKIKCWTTHANGKHSSQTLSDALNNSCNPIFMDIALSLGKDKYYEYIEKFGYGSATNIDFQGESIGMVLPKSTVKNCDLARISFGQTIAVSPLQLITATTAAVNGGYVVRPHLVKKLYSNDNKVEANMANGPVSRVVSEKTSKTVASMLEDVVTRGSGKVVYIPGYRVGGKTGTAQKYENGVIAQGKNVMSFVGFFPANSPKYVSLFIVDEPVGGGYGSTVAAPYVKSIFEQIIDYKHI